MTAGGPPQTQPRDDSDEWTSSVVPLATRPLTVEAVTGAAHRCDVAPAVGVVAELVAEALDGHVHEAEVSEIVEAPYPLQ